MANIPILYEDDSLWVIDKPPGLVVNRAESVIGETVQDWADTRLQMTDDGLQKADNIFKQRSGVVHRLDKDTSGCLLIAKNAQVLAELMAQFKNRQVQKKYLALVHGLVEPEEGSWRLPIARNPRQRHRFQVDPMGKISETHYRVRCGYIDQGGQKFTWLELQPKSGRTHQLRVHLSFLKHPIVADISYGNRLGKADTYWCPRIFLHAAEIKFTQPVNGKLITARSRLPRDLDQVLRGLTIAL